MVTSLKVKSEMVLFFQGLTAGSEGTEDEHGLRYEKNPN